MPTVLFSFVDSTERASFLQWLQSTTWAEALLGSQLDPVMQNDADRPVALFVAGSKLKEGRLEEISRAFTQECNAHHNSVQIMERRGKKWYSIRRRLRQR